MQKIALAIVMWTAVGMGQMKKQAQHAPPCSAKEAAVASTDGKSYCVAKPEMPNIVSMQLILDPVQAKYPGNEHVKPCGPTNHENACYSPSATHIINHLYQSLANCEAWEKVKCTTLDGDYAPIGKPVFEDKSAKPILGDETQGYQAWSNSAAIPMGTPKQVGMSMTSATGRIDRLSDEEYARVERLRKALADEERKIAEAHGVDFLGCVELKDGYFNCDGPKPDSWQIRGQWLFINVPVGGGR